jgi:LuxR family maltose regulon positive regulatory protein
MFMQAHPILQTKLYIPPIRPELVSRPRLIERLNAGLCQNQGFGRKLTLVSAPAGFGKTTLVTEWLNRSEHRFTWLSLDEGDNDLARFFTYFVAALQKIDANVGQAAQAMLQAPQPPPPETVLTSLINDIAASSSPFVLILDDYHLIDAPPIHQQLAFLLEHQPPPMHLGLVTRADPPLPLSRLRARSQMLEIRTDDLRFTTGEAAFFLNQVMGLNLSAEDAAALEARTEGWVVGLQMAALSLQSQEDAAGFIQAFSGSHHFVLDYLMDEVLSHQPEDVHRFLLHTSILERMTGPLCDAVCGEGTGTPNGQTMLEMLHRTNLFVVPLDTERCWYRYHHLFADLLRARLRQTLPDLVGALNRRASSWYEQHDLAAEAIHYALAAQDLDRAADLIEQNAMPAYQRGEMATLQNWIQALPEPVTRRHPGICIWHGWLLVSAGQSENAEPMLEDAERHIRPDDRSAKAQSWRGGVAVVRAITASKRGDVPATIHQSRLALEYLPLDDPVDRAHRITAGFFLGTGYVIRGDLTKAEQMFADAVELARADEVPFSAAMNLGELARLWLIRGRLHRAADLYQECQRLATSPEGRELPWMSIGKVGLGRLAYERNELDQAHRLFIEGIHHGKRWNSPDTLVAGHTVLSALLQAQGNTDGAGAALQEAAGVLQARQVRPDVRREWEIRRVRWWLSQGDVSQAQRWTPEKQLAPGEIPSFEQESAYVSLARVLIARNDLDAALDLLARLASGAETGGRTGRLVEILILQALALQAQGDAAQATTTLERALSLAGPEGYVRTFVDEGPPMALLLHQAAAGESMPDYAARLLAAFEKATGDEEKAELPPSSLVEPLTAREQELLLLVAEGLSNREIAAELFIALGTVKSHIHNIYGKLNAQNRVQAVARARELGLL